MLEFLKAPFLVPHFSYTFPTTFSTLFLPQGSILGHLLFNIFMCDIFLILKSNNVTGYAHDNTPLVIRENTINIIKALKDIGKTLIKSFSDN